MNFQGRYIREFKYSSRIVVMGFEPVSAALGFLLLDCLASNCLVVHPAPGEMYRKP